MLYNNVPLTNNTNNNFPRFLPWGTPVGELFDTQPVRERIFEINSIHRKTSYIYYLLAGSPV